MIVDLSIAKCIDIKQEVINISLSLNKEEKKALKLLSKQYEIDEIRRDAPEMFRDHKIVRENPLIITYYDLTNTDIKFEWIVKS